MCGIAGLFSKSLDVSENLGAHLGAMLLQLSRPRPRQRRRRHLPRSGARRSSKVSLFSPDRDQDGARSAASSPGAFGAGEPEVRASHAVIVVEAEAETAQAWLREHRPELRVMSAGQTIEIYKEAARRASSSSAFALGEMQGSHALGHTRMATESAVTTEHSHPFSTGLDLCLVHDGSLSNHNDLRRWLRKEGIRVRDGQRLRGRGRAT